MLGFNHAFRGIITLFKSERNFRIQIICLLMVIAVGIAFDVSSTEWIALLMSSGIVLSLEALNSSIEELCDLYSPEYNPRIKRIKDISAGAVLLFSLLAIIVAAIIFTPKAFSLLS